MADATAPTTTASSTVKTPAAAPILTTTTNSSYSSISFEAATAKVSTCRAELTLTMQKRTESDDVAEKQQLSKQIVDLQQKLVTLENAVPTPTIERNKIYELIVG